MSGGITDVAVFIWGSIATIAAVAAAVARWRSSSDETAAQLWRDEAQAWKAKSERLEAALAALEKRVEHLEAENRVLRALHDNRDELAALREVTIRGFASLTALLADRQEGE